MMVDGLDVMPFSTVTGAAHWLFFARELRRVGSLWGG